MNEVIAPLDDAEIFDPSTLLCKFETDDSYVQSKATNLPKYLFKLLFDQIKKNQVVVDDHRYTRWITSLAK